MIKRLEQFPENLVNTIENICFSPSVNWSYKRMSISPEKITEICSLYNFTPYKFGKHSILEKYWYQASIIHNEHRIEHLANKMLPFINYISHSILKKPVTVVKLKFNMHLYSSTNSICMPHIDAMSDDFVSFLYYVNESSGDTYFFDNDKNIIDQVSPKKGTAVLFDSNILHAGSYPKEEIEPRIVMTILFRYV